MAKKQKELVAAKEVTHSPAVENVPAVQSTHAPAVVQGDLATQLTAMGASASLVKRVVKASSNFALMETPKIPRIKSLSDGLLLDESNPDDMPVKEIQAVVLFGAKQKAWYEKEYDPQVKQPPECFAHGSPIPGVPMRPDSLAAKPQSKLCIGCEKNKFETAKVGKGKACRDLRRLFLLMSVAPGEESIMPMQFNITPTSLKNFDDYLNKLTIFGASIDEVVTKITGTRKTRDDKYLVYSFQRVRALQEDVPEDMQVIKNIKALKTAWMPHMEKAEIEAEDIYEESAPAQGEPVARAAAHGEY